MGLAVVTFSVVVSVFSVEAALVVASGFLVVVADDPVLLIDVSDVVTGFTVVEAVASVIGLSVVALGLAISGFAVSSFCSSLSTIASVELAVVDSVVI